MKSEPGPFLRLEHVNFSPSRSATQDHFFARSVLLLLHHYF